MQLLGREKPYVMAHRGSMAIRPENTLASFRQAVADGADILETDLHLTADGVFVCIHDATVDRTTNGSGTVAAMAYADLRVLSADCGQPEYRGEHIPRLEELLDMLPHDRALALELLADVIREEGVCRALATLLGESLTRTGVLSFAVDRLLAVRRAVPELPTGLITMRRLTPHPAVHMMGVFWPLLLVNPFYVWMAHQRGQLIAPLDPKPDTRLGLYQRLGVDAVLSNNPGETRRKMSRSHPESNRR
ncbi:MAG: glycerophosphodiester phosphodiesterase [Anaerolineae bacterium]